MKVCKICGEMKPLSEFHKHPKSKDGYNVRCKKCQNEYNKGKVAIAKHIHYCLNCGTRIKYSQKYCSRECGSMYRASLVEGKRKKVLEEWLNGDLTHCVTKSGITKGEITNRVKEDIIKPYLLKQQSHRCAICNALDIHNGQSLVFILDHIDGDWSNNYRSNFRLICPNCNSQLDTTKHNLGKGRYSTKMYQRKHSENLKGSY